MKEGGAATATRGGSSRVVAATATRGGGGQIAAATATRGGGCQVVAATTTRGGGGQVVAATATRGGGGQVVAAWCLEAKINPVIGIMNPYHLVRLNSLQILPTRKTRQLITRSHTNHERRADMTSVLRLQSFQNNFKIGLQIKYK